MSNKSYKIVTTQDEVVELMEHIESNDTIAYDTETTSLNPRDGQIIGFSVSGQVGMGYYFPTRIWNPQSQQIEDLEIAGIPCDKIAKKLLKMLVGKQLAMHNASFDTRYTNNFYGVDLLPSLWVDTALLVHTVQEEGAFGYGNPFGLKSIAIMVQKEIGLDVEKAANEEQLILKENIKANGGTTTKENFEIYKADMQILGEYAAADTDLTLRICNHFLQILQKEGLEKFFFEEEVMPLYREVTVPMEDRGIALDVKLIEKIDAEIQEDQKLYGKKVLDSLMALPKTREWIIDQAFKECPPSHKGKWASVYAEMRELPLPKTAKGYSFTAKTLTALTDPMDIAFLKEGNLEALPEELRAKISLKLWKEKNDGVYINIQSKVQLADIAFNYLGIKPLSETAKGKPQFDDDILEALAPKHDWAENLRIYNKLLKIKSTYIDRFYSKAENGVFYPYFKQNGTVSGRYGSDMQQLPKPKEDGEAAEIVIRYTNEIRAFFVSREGHKFVDCDYESLEPHLFASVSDDKNLQEIFSNGYDFYSYVAIRTEKMDGVSADKKAPNFLKKVDPVKRQRAKSYSLGMAYGMSPYALAMSLGIDKKEGAQLHAAYLEGFPGVANWIDKSREHFKEHGYVKNKVGRIRHLNKGKEVYDVFGDSIMDFRLRKNLSQEYGSEQVQRWYGDYKNALNNCLNFQIQSFAASVVNRAALAINRAFKERGWDAQVIAQIHDQLVMEVKEEYADEAAKIVQHLMQTTTQPPGIILKAPPEIAINLRDGH